MIRNCHNVFVLSRVIFMIDYLIEALAVFFKFPVTVKLFFSADVLVLHGSIKDYTTSI